MPIKFQAMKCIDMLFNTERGKNVVRLEKVMTKNSIDRGGSGRKISNDLVEKTW